MAPSLPDPDLSAYPGSESSRPYVRWWWPSGPGAGPFRREDITYQLDWLDANGFGGVELAWIGLPDDRPAGAGPAWLSDEFAELIGFAKRYADSLGLGCDFTFGSGSPLGGSWVRPEDAQQTLTGPSPQRLVNSWEPGPQPVVDHLSQSALRRYAEPLIPQYERGLVGALSALFCDAQRLDVAELWSTALWDRFEARYGYRLDGRLDLARTHPHMRYEYRRMVGAALLSGFFEAFAEICREQGAISRAQCHGLPVDPLAAYASVQVPEAAIPEYPPAYARIPASAAALTGRDLVSVGLGGGLYGAGDDAARYQGCEQLADLKLVADAALANGANHIIWHGMPFRQRGAGHVLSPAVRIGPDARYAAGLADFNGYLESVCGMLRRGRPFAQLAVYLPFEDALIQDRLPESGSAGASAFAWELRGVTPPVETAGFHPLWITEPFLRQAEYADGQLSVGGVSVAALYADAAWLDASALEQLVRLAQDGALIVLKRPPALPGMRRHAQYAGWLAELATLPNVVGSLDDLPRRFGLLPLMSGDDVPPFWARAGAGELLIFVAHPQAAAVRGPLRYGQSYADGPIERTVTLSYAGTTQTVTLRFQPQQSLVIRLTRTGEFSLLDLDYRPPAPVRER